MKKQLQFTEFEKVYKQTKQSVEELSGCFAEIPMAESYLLLYLMQANRYPVFCELGVGNGKTACAIASAFTDEQQVIVIDKDAVAEEYPKCYVIRRSPMDIFGYICEDISKINVLYINSDKNSINHFSLYESLLVEGGFLALNMTNPENRRHYEKLSSQTAYAAVFETEWLVIFKRTASINLYEDNVAYLKQKLHAIYDRIHSEPFELIKSKVKPRIALGVLTYNHGKFIKKCLEGVFAQKGYFDLKVVIVNDCSTDNTKQEIDDFIRIFNEQDQIEVVVIHNEKNIGAIESIQLLIRQLSGHDYFSYIEGDDYWSDPRRTQAHIDLLTEHPECGFSVNKFCWYMEKTKSFYRENHYSRMYMAINHSYDLISHYIGNMGCYFFRGEYLEKLDYAKFKRLKIEWATIVWFSLTGDCAFLDEEYNVYRKHDGGTWSTLECEVKSKNLLENLNILNKELNYIFDLQLNEKYVDILKGCFVQFQTRLDLMVVDEPIINGENIEISPVVLNLLKRDSFSGLFIPYYSALYNYNSHPKYISNLFTLYKRTHWEFESNLFPFTMWHNMSAKIMVTLHWKIAYMSLSFCERYQIPFIFYLQSLTDIVEDKESTNRLKRILRSTMLQGVFISNRELLTNLQDQFEYESKRIYIVDNMESPQEAAFNMLNHIDDIVSQLDYEKLNQMASSKRPSADTIALYDQYHVIDIKKAYTPQYVWARNTYNRYCPKWLRPLAKKIKNFIFKS